MRSAVGERRPPAALQGLLLLPDPETGLYEVGVHEKAVAALESLLFAKYQMFRNVYWHHAVRAATALYKRIVEESVRGGILDPEELIGPTDEGLLYEIGRRSQEDDSEVAEIRPHRSRARIMQILQAVVEKNHALRADTDIRPEPAKLNEEASWLRPSRRPRR